MVLLSVAGLFLGILYIEYLVIYSNLRYNEDRMILSSLQFILSFFLVCLTWFRYELKLKWEKASAFKHKG